jgi:hypothetical protein
LLLFADGKTSAVKKGDDNLGYSGDNHVKDGKVVAFCDRHCNVIAPFICAPGNRNGSPLLREPGIRGATTANRNNRLTYLYRRRGSPPQCQFPACDDSA